ncbi:MAG: hypothetical protein A2Y14_02190 [Verrucomicrobia bacterium GWF2_51_19]|nr:MAG: hypothetical protein A2Y14_02190 [Verrucomicrobia bacterium GWF2_51_19]HCJ12021.1 M23 family peptidase [Opitutae bacterium]
MFLFRISFFLPLALLAETTLATIGYPTALSLQNGPQTFIQPTIAGTVESGMWGNVREYGRRFHKGIDIRSAQKDRRGEPTDPVLSILDGTVMYVNKVSGRSSYGCYVVVQHDLDMPLFTTYAHMSHIDVVEGQKVVKGQSLGIMGRNSLGRLFPKDRAHVHFETGLQLSNSNFQAWYNKTYKRTNPNFHGLWNGLNFIAWNPLAFYAALNQGVSLSDFIKNLPTDLVVRIRTQTVPAFVTRYPKLLKAPLPAKVEGWEIEFTWFGLPKAWTPMTIAPAQRRSFVPSPSLRATHQDLLYLSNNNPKLFLEKVLYLCGL